jgi:hypothetical protein
MEHIGPQLAKIDQNIKLNTTDPVARDGFRALSIVLALCGLSNVSEVAAHSPAEWPEGPKDAAEPHKIEREPERVGASGRARFRR